MIKATDLLALFNRMYREHWSYEPGAAREGCVDCSGAFSWAFKRLGGSIPHGSNAIARGYVNALLPISQAVPGMAAFKIRKPGQQYYDLPAKYRSGSDLNDYYHIGLVDETGQYVLNAQGTKAGFTRTKIGTWGAVGYLKNVSYEHKEDQPMQTMIVHSDNGDPVRVRKQPSTAAETVAKLAVGTTVSAGEEVNGWRAISANGRSGYMMSKFLIAASEGAEPATPTDLAPAGYTKTLSTTEFGQLCEMRDQLKDMYDTLKSIVGVG